jgi:thioredoxin 1
MNPKFLQIINSSRPVLVDFYAEWCIPCKEVHPVLKKVKQEMGQVKIVKVDVDKNPYIASHYKINSLPTLMIFKKGKPYGLVRVSTVQKNLKQFLRISFPEVNLNPQLFFILSSPVLATSSASRFQ